MGADPESEHAIIGFANAAMVLPKIDEFGFFVVKFKQM